MIDYYPFGLRTEDTQYRTLLMQISVYGDEVDTQQEYPARRRLGHLMRFGLRNGFPIITERDLVSEPSQFKFAIAELCAFLNGARHLSEMKKFGCGWWARWVTAEKCKKRGLEAGDLGPGSYGAAWRNFPTVEGKPFDQIQTLIEQIEEMPHLRTLRVTNWIPQYIPRGKNWTQKVVVAPCHGDFRIDIDTRRREMSLVHTQRSADAPVGLVFNIIQYAALLMMIAQVTGYTPHELVYFVDNGHIFLKKESDPDCPGQMQDVEKLLATPPGKFPTVTLDPDVKNLFDFRPEHFKVDDYYPRLGRMVIWTPV